RRGLIGITAQNRANHRKADRPSLCQSSPVCCCTLTRDRARTRPLHCERTMPPVKRGVRPAQLSLSALSDKQLRVPLPVFQRHANANSLQVPQGAALTLLLQLAAQAHEPQHHRLLLRFWRLVPHFDNQFQSPVRSALLPCAGFLYCEPCANPLQPIHPVTGTRSDSRGTPDTISHQAPGLGLI